ncbi:energy-coupling factor transporter transmembrane component T [Liquorilactobacillus oeni]|uniref:ABC transporter permease n=1 Tax=Liquorilactobacillus oeni DSM 19972 TaxID=1423777 RepID=A0A0R1MJQ7_9LACO|nr:energy-coupling factor transporter transmembrane component T [Liquorilactobacillus oeni]KRL05418.1 ABC transporter permease [Liquorilactobacillus oeni DSM 19972]
MKAKQKINPAVLSIIMLGIGLQIAFSQSVILNLIVTLVSLAYLIYCRVSLKVLFFTLLVALPLAFGSWWSFLVFGTGDRLHNAWIYGTRVYSYLTLGAAITLTVPVKELLLSLSLHLKLSPTFVYGLLAAFNLFERIRFQFKHIQYSAQMRGKTYYPWQPALYLRIIIVALNWSGDLAEAMTSQGFSEGYERTMTFNDRLPFWQWVLCLTLILAYFWAAFILRPW